MSYFVLGLQVSRLSHSLLCFAWNLICYQSMKANDLLKAVSHIRLISLEKRKQRCEFGTVKPPLSLNYITI